MAKTTFSIELPFFPGFYESPFYNSDTLYWEFNDDDNMEYYKERFGQDITPDDLDIDWKEYTTDVCKDFCEVFNNLCPDGLVESVEFDEMTSPKYYNYSTDKCYAEITLAENYKEQFLDFIEKNLEWFKERIKKDWTSYDGFWSFMENDVDSWKAEFMKEEPDERYISTMLGYILYKDNKNVKDDLIVCTMEDIYISEYVILTKEEKKVD